MSVRGKEANVCIGKGVCCLSGERGLVSVKGKEADVCHRKGG